MSLTEDQRAALQRSRLRALVRDLTGGDCDPVTVGVNAAALSEGTALLLSTTATPALLAGSIAWTLRSRAERTVLLVDDFAGDLARMAGHFTHPVEVREVRGVSSVPVTPTPFPGEVETDTDAELEAQLRAAGLEVVVEDGVVRGEVRGLEVARLVRWPVDSGGDGLLHLEAGVGRFDRDAVAAMHQGEPPTTTLGRSAAMVAAQRIPGAGAHPLSRLARERWLRWSLLQDPSVVGVDELTALETTVRRDNVRDVSPAAAVGVDRAGHSVVVVCSTGADLSFVPIAADTRAWHDPTAELLLVVPERDRLATLELLASLVTPPATVLTVPEPWAADPGAQRVVASIGPEST